MSTAEIHRPSAPANGAVLHTGVAHRIDSDEEALARARTLRETLAAGAAERDRERTLPRAEVERLSREGLLAITVPRRFGGAGVRVETLAQVAALLASADPNVAQIPQSQFVYLELARQVGTDAQQELLFGEVLDGRRIANAQSEAGSKTVADIQTSLRRRPNGSFLLEGQKFYCTGSLLAHWLTVLAKDEDGRTRVAIVPERPRA